MLFNSLDFLVFLALFFALWPWLRKTDNLRWLYISAASFLFYGWWDWRFLSLILFCGFAAFLAGLGMERFPRRRRLMLVLAILAHVGNLAVFKYLDFSITTFNALFSSVTGSDAGIPLMRIILPVGISFYTFQAMSYVIDVYRRDMAPTRNVLHFFAYLSMFPQLVAGPIVRASHLLPQLTEDRRPSSEEAWQGLRLVVFGFFKKVVVADTLAPAVNAAFSTAIPEASAAYWWIVMLMFSVQIYGDFSGYSDIARGLGRWMGYDFPVNFNHPYVASSFREFWSRWHISLSSWFRDYVYIPLGGSRRGPNKAILFMWITMLVSGLWHGAAWAFVFWGALHAGYLTIERLTNWPRRVQALPFGRFLGTAFVFALVLIAWVFFRVGSLDHLTAVEQFRHALQIVYHMTNLGAIRPESVALVADKWCLLLVLLVLLRQLQHHPDLVGLRGRVPALEHRLRWWLEPAVMASFVTACVYLRGPGAAFIYFQF